MVVPYLGFLSDSARQVFHLIPEKKNKLLKLIREVLDTKTVTIKTPQHLVNVFPSPYSFLGHNCLPKIYEALSKGHLSSKLIRVCRALREKISHWFFLETWDDSLPRRDERIF